MTAPISNRMDRERERRASLAGHLESRMQRQRDDRRFSEQTAFESALQSALQGGGVRSTGAQNNDDGTAANRWPPAELAQGSPVFSLAAAPGPKPAHGQDDADPASPPGDAVTDQRPLQVANPTMPGLCAGHEAPQRPRGELPPEPVVDPARLQGPAADDRAGGHWRFELAEPNLPVRALAVQRAAQGQLRVTLLAPDHPTGTSMQAPLLRLQQRLAEHGATLSAEDEIAPLG